MSPSASLHTLSIQAEQVGQQPLIVVADDDAGSRLLMRSALERGGFRVSEASDGAAAVAIAARGECHAVLLDVEMPRMDGFEACAAIRSIPAGANLPIMIVTGRNDVESIDRAFCVGATDFLAKPIGWGLIAHRVRYLVRGGQLVNDLKMSEGRQRALLSALPDRLFVIDAADRVVHQLGAASTASSPQAGLSAVVGQHVYDLVAPDQAEAFARALVVCRAEARVVELEFSTDTSPDGRRYEARLVPYDDGRTLAVLRDVTERHRSEARIRELAYFDSLTRLPKREFLLKLLGDALPQADAADERLAVLHLALDDFRRINDSFGHVFADELLRAVAQNLQRVLGASTDGQGSLTLARLDASEFVVLARSIGSDADVTTLIARIMSAFSRPFTRGHEELLLTVSIGVALFPAHGADSESLLRTASAALGEARAVGPGRSAIYDSALHARMSERVQLEGELRRAIESGTLSLAYQPQFDLASGRIVGVEALARWRHPVRGVIGPQLFIPVAEKAGLIAPLTNWVMRTALQQIASWRPQNAPELRVAVNISATHFLRGEFATWLQGHLVAAGVPGSALEIEITESMLMVDEVLAARTLSEVRALGVHVAIDDFGTGYSSLAYLRSFALEALKVDRSFVADLGQSASEQAICAAIIAMGRRLGLRVVAEGVETPLQLQLLREHGCNEAQGFLLARPVPADEATELLDRCREDPGSVMAAAVPDFDSAALCETVVAEMLAR